MADQFRHAGPEPHLEVEARVYVMSLIKNLNQPSDVMQWLLAGDTAVQFQVWRDIMGDDRPELEQHVALDGDAAAILSAQRSDGHWGRGFYQPKWTCSHYSLMELRDLGVS
ncbi:MAG: hypothetical protein IT190_00625, partial [Microbacteriaceae bacterium]|nr:hypothetical protein [Microbacteriaceae bacterium]